MRYDKGTVNVWTMADGSVFNVVQVAHPDDPTKVKDEVVVLSVELETCNGKLVIDTFSAWGNWDSVDTDYSVFANAILPIEIWFSLKDDTTRIVSGKLQLPSPHDFKYATDWMQKVGQLVCADIYKHAVDSALAYIGQFGMKSLTYENKKVIYENICRSLKLSRFAIDFFEFYPPKPNETGNVIQLFKPIDK